MLIEAALLMGIAVLLLGIGFLAGFLWNEGELSQCREAVQTRRDIDNDLRRKNKKLIEENRRLKLVAMGEKQSFLVGAYNCELEIVAVRKDRKSGVVLRWFSFPDREDCIPEKDVTKYIKETLSKEVGTRNGFQNLMRSVQYRRLV